MLMHQLLIDGAVRHPEKAAFRWIDKSQSLTYADAARRMEDLAGALHELGVGKGDRVAVFAHNGMDYLLSMFGCWRIGAIAALVNVRFADELEYYFQDHEPSVVVYTHDMADPVRQAAATVPSIRSLVCMDGPQDGALSLPELMAGHLPAPADPGDEEAIAHLSYTSGTTGKPKGACLAHEPTMRATRCIAERLRLSAADVSFGPTALSSSYGLVANLLPVLHRGGTTCVMAHWTSDVGWDHLDKTGATVFAANPTLLTDVLVESRARGKTPWALRMGVSGGGPVPTPLKAAWRDELYLPLVESYGQSELGGFVALGFPDLQPDATLSAIGLPLPDKEVRILDADGIEVPIGEVGEICLRGGHMVGYWNKPEKTKEAFRGGWLHTGDTGCMDADGRVTMRGRFSELLSVAGRTWFPRDVEEALISCEEVREAAVVGIPDPELGHRPRAFITEASAITDPSGLKSRIASMVPYDLTPLEIAVVREFPMTPTGKIAKATLCDAAIAGTV